MDDTDLSSHAATQSELRASAGEFPFGLRSPAALRVSWSSLIFLWGGAAVVVVVCRALCSHLPRPFSPVLRLSSPPPPPPFFFTVRGSGGGVCRRRPAARNSPPGPPSRPVAVAIGRHWILLFLLLIGISKAVVLFGLRLRSPPVPRSGSVETRTEFLFPRRKAPTRAAFDPGPSLMTRESSHVTPVIANHTVVPARLERSSEGAILPPKAGDSPKQEKYQENCWHRRSSV